MLQPTQSSGAIYQYLPMGHRLHMQLRAVHEGNRKEHAKHRAEHVYRRRQARNAARCFAVNRGGVETADADRITNRARAQQTRKATLKNRFPEDEFQASRQTRRASDKRVRYELLEAFRVLHGVDDREVLAAHALAVLGGLVVVSRWVSTKHPVSLEWRARRGASHRSTDRPTD